MADDQGRKGPRGGRNQGGRSGRWERAGGRSGAPSGRGSGAPGSGRRDGGRGRSLDDDRRSGGGPDRGGKRPGDDRRRQGDRGRPGRRSSGGNREAGAQGGRREHDEHARGRGPSEQRGPRSWDRRKPSGAEDAGRRREPPLPEEITGKELDRSVWTGLRTLTKENAEGVARHLVASAYFLEEDPDRALEHAEHAARRAGRVAGVREALGLVRYRRGEFGDALREFRTARRLSGSDHLLPYMVDCERGLGRLDRALELAGSKEAQGLSQADNIELAIVVSGVRRDLGQYDAALVGLRIPALQRATTQPWAARLLYAYADALLATGDESGARDWFAKAVDADSDGATDAADRLDELDGLVMTDLLADDTDESPDEPEPGDDPADAGTDGAGR